MQRLSEERWRTLPDGRTIRNVEHASPTSAGDEPTASEYEDMSKDELVSELEARGLPKTGNKDELIERLREADEDA